MATLFTNHSDTALMKVEAAASCTFASPQRSPALQEGVIENSQFDVTSLSLGIETLGGMFTKLIEQNTNIPIRKSEVFSTVVDNQTSVDIHMLQGERLMADDNKSLGSFQLSNITPAPRGVPQVEVTFDIDMNGILLVFARELKTGHEQKVSITSPVVLSKEEIDKTMKEADIHADEDNRKREAIESELRLASLIYSTERTINNHREQIPVSMISDAEAAIAEVKKAIEAHNSDHLHTHLDNLAQASNRITEMINQQQSSQASGEDDTFQ